MIELLRNRKTKFFLPSFQILASIKIGPEEDEQKTKLQKIVNKMFWLIGTSRNAILVVVCGVVGYSFKNAEMTPFKLIGDIPPGLPSVQLPPFSMDSGETFSEMLSSMGSGLIVVPLIALMESIAICKAFSNGKSVDATQGNVDNDLLLFFSFFLLFDYRCIEYDSPKISV